MPSEGQNCVGPEPREAAAVSLPSSPLYPPEPFMVSCRLIVGSQHLLGRMKWHLAAHGRSLVGAWDSCHENLPPCLVCPISDKSSSTESPLLPGQVAPGLSLSTSLRWQSRDPRMGGTTRSLCKMLHACRGPCYFQGGRL